MRSRLSLLLLIAGLGTGAVRAQNDAKGHVEVLNADSWTFDNSWAQGAQRLIGNVRLAHEDVRMWCDSAYLYPDDRVSAFGSVVLKQGDTLRITGNRLDYATATGQARITGSVQLTDNSMDLATDALTYDMHDRTARYDTGGRLENRKARDVLTSNTGTYDARTEVFTFVGNVHLENPDRTIDADTLRYHAPTERVTFLGPTHIIQDSTAIYCERGTYDPRTTEGLLTMAGRIITNGQALSADSLYFKDETGEGRGWGHVMITDTVNNMVVKGEEGTHQRRTGESMVTGRAELQMGTDADTLFLHADTLFASNDTNDLRVITARRNVRFFRPDMQGVCDTMHYAEADSLITLLGDPFIWHEQDQISGDTVHISLWGGKVRELLVEGTAFMASQVDSTHFDQVTGLRMTGHFEDDKLKRVVAEGNSRTIYHATEKQDSVETVTGLNRADCSVIVVGLDSGKVSTVSFITQPTATLYPINKVPPGEMELEGFRWNAEARPGNREDIFRRTPPAEPPGNPKVAGP